MVWVWFCFHLVLLGILGVCGQWSGGVFNSQKQDYPITMESNYTFNFSSIFFFNLSKIQKQENYFPTKKETEE